jgi:hypothetical protein
VSRRLSGAEGAEGVEGAEGAEGAQDVRVGPGGQRSRRRYSRDNAGHLAFAEMTADAERMGLYGADPEEVQAALKAARKKPAG